MSILETAYARCYQGVMKLACYFLPFREPELIQGPGSIKKLPAFIASKGFKSVLIVTDKGLMSFGLLNGLFASLTETGIAYKLFDGVQANPTIGNIEAALALYKEGSCEAIIAFGGGSSMDCAKATGARVSNPRKTVQSLRGLLKVTHKPPILFAVPTTAGTGSETTVAAVVSDPSTHEKYAINDTKLIPPYAVLDPELTVSLPPQVTSTTGMDALTHAVEAYIGRSNTKRTREMAEKSVKLVFDNIETAYRDGKNIEARANMLLASYCGGVAFTRAYVGYVHAMAHNLGGMYGTPHGLANAVILPKVLDRFGASANRPLARLSDVAGVSKPGMSEGERARAFINAVKKLNKDMAIPEYIDAIREEDLPVLVSRARHEGVPLYPVPTIWGAEEFEAAFRSVMRPS